MIKLYLQHKLFEQAIDAFFNSLGRNFASVNVSDFKVGDRYCRIHYHCTLDDRSIGIYGLYDVEVISIDGGVIGVLCKGSKTYYELDEDGVQISPMSITECGHKHRPFWLTESQITLAI